MSLEELIESISKYTGKPKRKVLQDVEETAQRYRVSAEVVARSVLKAFLTCR